MAPFLDPDRNVCVLMHDIARLVRRSFDKRMRPLGFTQAQWRVLISIHRNEGINQAPLADMLEIQPITLARLIDKMAAAGLVERRPDPTDRRAVCLHLTPQAQPILDVMEKEATELRERVLSGISEETGRQVIEALQTMKGNLLEAEAGDEALSLLAKKSARA